MQSAGQHCANGSPGVAAAARRAVRGASGGATCTAQLALLRGVERQSGGGEGGERVSRVPGC